MTYRDPILDELYAVREKMLAESGNDLLKLVERQSKTPLPPGMRSITIEEVRSRQTRIDAVRDVSIATVSQ